MNDDKKYWDDIEQRFFDGLTTEEEELELERRIALLDEHGFSNATTATLSFIATGRKFNARKSRRWFYVATAASIALLISVGAALFSNSENLTGNVQIGGVEVAQTEEALTLMRQDLALIADGCPSVDNELDLLFQ